MKILLIAGSAMLLPLLTQAAPAAPDTDNPLPVAPVTLTDVRWTAEPADGAQDAPRLRLRHGPSNSDTPLDANRPEFAAAAAALADNAPGPIHFTVSHDAGTLACTGERTSAYAGKGRCRFTADPHFERQLAARGLAPRQRATLLAMLMVDATIEQADGLIREGVRPENADDLIAAAALDITPAYVRDLRSDALVLTRIEDAIACKAMDIDGAYVRDLAAAGYHRLSAQDVVAMKAMGITGAYAMAMNRAAEGNGR